MEEMLVTTTEHIPGKEYQVPECFWLNHPIKELGAQYWRRTEKYRWWRNQGLYQDVRRIPPHRGPTFTRKCCRNGRRRRSHDAF